MALSNAERQRRYRIRLKDRANWADAQRDDTRVAELIEMLKREVGKQLGFELRIASLQESVQKLLKANAKLHRENERLKGRT